MPGDVAVRASTYRWLVAGIVFGAGATAGLALVVAGLIRGDAPTTALGPPLMMAETAATGIDHVYDGDFNYFVGGGVAVFDCDDDGRPDLYFAGGAKPAAMYRNGSSAGGELSFTPVEGPMEVTGVTGAYPIDIDSDGNIDLVVLRVDENLVLRGLGDCRFEVANDRWNIDGGNDWTVAFSATWEQGQTLPTLVFGNYLVVEDSSDVDRTCADSYLVRPDGDTYAPAVALAPGWCTLSALFSDWDRSGRRDLRLTNDRHYNRDGEEQLWRIEAGAPPRLYTRDEGWERLHIWGMGIASHDLTGDGLPEVYLTSQGDNKLQKLADGPARPTYEDIALPTGTNSPRPFVGDTTRPSTSWHPEFGDLNNDGFVDVFVTKGNVEAQPEFAAEDPNSLLLGQLDGTFVEVADQAGLLDFAHSRGAALVDLDLDGLLDVVVVERREPVKLWRNVSEQSGNWLAVGLEQEAPNRHAVGSWVQVRLGNVVLGREVTVGGGHAGGQLGRLHFGLGRAGKADIRIQWPNGDVTPWTSFEANQFITLRP
ncbi:CRTAC1 family protein [soil metagenome]